jgi:hypothetical protein
MRLFRRNPRRLPGSLCDETPAVEHERSRCKRCGGVLIFVGVAGQGMVWKHADGTVSHEPVLTAEWVEETTPAALPGFTADVPLELRVPMPIIELDSAGFWVATQHRCGDGCGACGLLQIELAGERAEATRLLGELESARKSAATAGHIIAGMPTSVAELQFQLADRTRELEEECGINADLRRENTTLRGRVEGLELTLRSYATQNPTDRRIEAARKAV